MARKAIYSGLFLEEEARNVLLMSVELACGEVLPHVHAHHLTLKFRPNPEEVRALAIGEVIDLRVKAVALDERAQAVLCLVPETMVCGNEHPHITVATGTDAEGKHIPPRVSNEMLEAPSSYYDAEFVLKARVGIFTGKEVQYDLVGTIYE